MKRRAQRGIAIEYVMLTMALVAGLVAALLAAASLTAQTARGDRDHIERKECLDDGAERWLDWLESRDCTAVELERELNGNAFGFDFHVGSVDFFATENRAVVLYVEIVQEETGPRITAYRYGYL